MALRVVFRNGSTESIDGVAEFDIYSGKLTAKNAAGEIVAEREDVASAGQVTAAADN